MTQLSRDLALEYLQANKECLYKQPAKLLKWRSYYMCTTYKVLLPLYK